MKMAQVSRMNPLFDTGPVVVQTTSQPLCQSNGQGVFFPEFVETEQARADGEGINKTAAGSLGEILFDLWCLANRIPVFQPVANQTKEDRVIKLGGRYVSVQIKSGGMGNNGPKTVFSLWAGIPYKAAVGKAPKRRPESSDADLLFCIGMDYSRPCLDKSFAHVRAWSDNLPQSLSLPNGVGWPPVSHVEAVLAGEGRN
jgi:hypothetical protein